MKCLVANLAHKLNLPSLGPMKTLPKLGAVLNKRRIFIDASRALFTYFGQLHFGPESKRQFQVKSIFVGQVQTS